MKDPIYNTTHPETGKVTVTADWSRMGSGITQPEEYTIALGGDTYTATTDTYTLPLLVVPGNYTLYLYNNADNIAVGGTVATVATSGIGIDALPGWFFTGTLDTTVEEDTDHEFTIPMQQQVRQLTLLVEPEGATAGDITAITGTLSGVAGSYDMASGTHGAASEVTLAFTKITEGADAGKWATTVRLLGTSGNVQRLAGTITFAGGNPRDIDLESDLSAALDGFNADKATPLLLGGTVVETPTDPEFGATITDWTPNPGGSVIAN